MKTLQEAAKFALQIQDAPNALAILNAFKNDYLPPIVEAVGADWAQHPITRLVFYQYFYLTQGWSEADAYLVPTNEKLIYELVGAWNAPHALSVYSMITSQVEAIANAVQD